MDSDTVDITVQPTVFMGVKITDKKKTCIISPIKTMIDATGDKMRPALRSELGRKLQNIHEPDRYGIQ